jgi:AraC-like DNA-binding protein
LVDPGENYLVHHITSGLDISNIVMDPRWMTAEIIDAESPVRSGHFGATCLHDESMAREVVDLAARMASPHSSVLECEQRVRALFYQALLFSQDQPPGQLAAGCVRAVLRARDLIEDRFAAPLSLTEIAAACGLSKFYLERSFAARFGTPMHRFQTMVRVRRAMELMRQGLRPTDVARRVGFSDHSHMHRTFVQTTSFTPGAYFRAGRR